jgi:hypothetical protein
VKSPEVNFGNDQICDMADFDEKSRWIGWSKNEFSHSLYAPVNSDELCFREHVTKPVSRAGAEHRAS